SQDVVRMANFKGHALPGSFFLVFGLWWSVKYPLRYLSQKASKKSQKNYFFQRMDAIEGGVKITFALIGMLAEQFVPDGPHLYLYSGEKRDWVKLMNWQHTTMYLFYGLSGVVDIFTYACSVVPRGLDRLMLSTAVFVEGRTMLEVFLRDNIVLEMFRAGVTIVQGTWFWQTPGVIPMPTSFLGSALRGTFFLIFGLWWSVRYPLKYLRRKTNAENQPSYGIQRVEVFEGAFKAFFALAGILVEQFVPSGPHLMLYSPKTHSWTDLTHWHYTTMYLFFLLSGIVDVLSHSPLKLPLGLDRLSLSVALFMEGFLFCFHAYGDAALDQHLHSLLAFAIFAGALCTLLEVFLRDHIILECLRTSTFLLQGSWLWQVSGNSVLTPELWASPQERGRDTVTKEWQTTLVRFHSFLSVFQFNCNESCQLRFGDIDVELDCGMCMRKKGSGGALLPEGGMDEK
ncbi:hypothetical protein ASZ78_007668, partial [Callipepla squamata]